MKRVRVFISGKVQGVFFRMHAKEKADKLSVFGWVKNLPDKRVEAVFEGEKEKIDEIIKWCYSGSPEARVIEIKVKEEKVRGKNRFEVRS